MTHAKIGRWTKKWLMAVAQPPSFAGTGLTTAPGLILFKPSTTSRSPAFRPERHEPFITQSAVGNDVPLHHAVVSVEDHCGRVAGRSAGNALLGREHRVAHRSLHHLDAHEHARQQHLIGVRERRPQSHGAGILVDRHLRKLDPAGPRVVRTVFEFQVHRGRGGKQLSLGQGPPQRQQLSGGLRDVDVDRVELLDGCEGGLLVGVDQGAGGDGGAADAAADRGGHAGVLDAQRGGGKVRFVLVDIRLRLIGGRNRIVDVLLAERADLGQRLVAIRARLSRLRARARVLELRGRLITRGDIAAIVDLIEGLTRPDQGALHEQPLLDEAVDLRTYVRGHGRCHPAGEHLDQCLRSRREGDDADFNGATGESGRSAAGPWRAATPGRSWGARSGSGRVRSAAAT